MLARIGGKDMMRPRVVTLLLAAACCGLLVSACAGANRGVLRNSREVGRAFETLHAYPEYRYWYLNQENNPYAVVGLESDYRLEDVMWTPVQPDSPTFEKVVGLVQSFPVPGGFTYGAYIIDPSGRTIGVWYSSMSAGINVSPETRLVSISTGTPWTDDNGLYGSGVGIGIGGGSGGGGVGIRLGF
jgi:hypothetical protein